MRHLLKIVSILFLGGAVIYMSNEVVPVFQSTSSKTQTKEYVLLAQNDLGMHCMQKDYGSFLILPPANTLKLQVFEKGKKENRLVTSGIKVEYEILDNTTSANKVNFWNYAKDYGFNVEENIGITGNGLKGEMKLSEDKKYFEATAIPLTPYNDNDKKLNPYQIAKITVSDIQTGKVLAIEDSIVVPVSNELECQVCHGETNTNLNILNAHDKLSGTQLVSDLENNKRYKCADCHQDNAIGVKGIEGIEPLSQAMHGFHADKMKLSSIQNPSCYSCHPGPVTQCYRGIMKTEGISCGEGECHGDMVNIASSQAMGRQAWLQEPECQECHESAYQTNSNTLYRNSYLNNAPGRAMNGLIQCESCHNSPHAEWTSELALDNKLPENVQGEATFINKCSTCHTDKQQSKMHKGGIK